MTYQTITNLLESHPESDLYTLLTTKCQPYLREARGLERPFLFRGIQGTNYAHRVVTVRKDRRPTDSDPKFHAMIDEVLSNLGYVANRSNSAFTTGAAHGNGAVVAGQYGRVYIAIPVGQFDITWSSRFHDWYSEASGLVKIDPLTKIIYTYCDDEDKLYTVKRCSIAFEQNADFMSECFPTIRSNLNADPTKVEQVRAAYELSDTKYTDVTMKICEWMVDLIDHAPKHYFGSRAEQVLPAIWQLAKVDPTMRVIAESWQTAFGSSLRDDDLKAAIESTHEVMVACSELVLINYDLWLNKEGPEYEALVKAFNRTQ